jgi:hypothetical protein
LAELYPYYLDRPDEYAACEAYWANLCRSVCGTSSHWQPWLNREGDGNPIYDLICPTRRLAFRVVQVPDDGAARQFAWWTKRIEVGVDTLPNGEYHELVFRCTLTHDTAALAHPLFAAWVADGRVPEMPN